MSTKGVKKTVSTTSPTKKVKRSKTSPTKRVKKAESNKPKRPRTAFIMYMSDHREQIIKSHPGIKFTEITKIGGEQWKAVKPAVKAKYEQASAKDKERYNKEMESYVPDPNEKKKKRTKKDPDAPKRAKIAYTFYAQSQFPKVKKEHPDYKPTQVITQIGVQWKALSDREKKPFNDLAAKDKARYEAEMAAYKQ
jgi:hypothetical protein